MAPHFEIVAGPQCSGVGHLEFSPKKPLHKVNYAPTVFLWGASAPGCLLPGNETRNAIAPLPRADIVGQVGQYSGLADRSLNSTPKGSTPVGGVYSSTAGDSPRDGATFFPS